MTRLFRRPAVMFAGGLFLVLAAAVSAQETSPATTPWAGSPGVPTVVPPLQWFLPSALTAPQGAAGAIPSKAIFLVDDFEDGNLDGWLSGGGLCASGASNATAGLGTYSMVIQGACGHFGGRYYQSFSLAGTQVSLKLRPSSPSIDQAYFVVGDDNVEADGGVIFFWAASNGHWMMFDGTLLYDCGAYSHSQWYDISFGLDWDKRVARVSIDGTLRQVNVPFRSSTAAAISRIHAYNWGESSVAYWDHITISTPPPSVGIFFDGFESGDATAWTSSLPIVPPVILLLRSSGILGAIGGRSGADLRCLLSGTENGLSPASWFRAFISVSSSDEIRDMPANYNVPTNRRILGPNGTKVADNWTDLLDGTIDASLFAAGMQDGVTGWFSGSNLDGSLAAQNCAGWTASSVLQGRYGLTTATGAQWMSMASDVCGLSTLQHLVCLAWRE